MCYFRGYLSSFCSSISSTCVRCLRNFFSTWCREGSGVSAINGSYGSTLTSSSSASPTLSARPPLPLRQPSFLVVYWTSGALHEHIAEDLRRSANGVPCVGALQPFGFFIGSCINTGPQPPTTPTLSPQLAHANIPPASSSPFKLTAEKKSATQQVLPCVLVNLTFSAITCNDV